MSYNFWVEIDTGGDEPHGIDPSFGDEHPELAGHGTWGRCGNYTSNVSGMWTDCLTAGTKSEKPLGLRDLDGCSAEMAAGMLADALAWGLKNIERLRKKNPANGWGRAEGALLYLWDMQRHCEAHPKATLRVVN